MADYSFTAIVKSLTEGELFADLLSRLKGRGLPTIEWGADDPIQVILQHGLSPVLAKLHDFASVVARGGFLSYAQELAEADLTTWNDNPLNTFLGWVAQEWYQITPKPPEFAEGTIRFVNASAANYTLTTATVVGTPTGLRLRFAEAAPKALPAGATVFARVKAETPGTAYNLPSGAVTVLVTSLPGVTVSNQPEPPNTSWLLVYGASREAPAAVAVRCRSKWGRLQILHQWPEDGYRNAALDPVLTGTNVVRKVAVWPHSRDGNQEGNAVTLYLAGDAGPAAAQIVTQVRDRLLAYAGLHDRLYAFPCGAASYAPAGTAYVRRLAEIPGVTAAIQAAFAAYQTELQIGEAVPAWQIRQRVDVPGVVDFDDALTRFVPNKNALVTLSSANIVVAAR